MTSSKIFFASMVIGAVLWWLGWKTYAPALPLRQQTARDDPPLKLPEWWKAEDPLPAVKRNCVRCHLTAGRELTVPVRDYARSVHDRAKLSCDHCHGGNTEADATAHEHEFGFIGTKMSAHIEACASCHSPEAKENRQGKHHWDLKKRINRDYPVCIDCHGNHDIGKPPKEFTLTNVCTECHKDFAQKMPGLAAVAAANDRLWHSLRQVHARNRKESDPTPADYRDDLAVLRRDTAAMVHPARPITADQGQALARRLVKLQTALDAWLKKQP